MSLSTRSLTTWFRQCCWLNGLENHGKHFVRCLRHGSFQVIFSSSEMLLVSPSHLVESPHRYRNSVVKMERPPCHEPRDHVGDEPSCANRTRRETSRGNRCGFPATPSALSGQTVCLDLDFTSRVFLVQRRNRTQCLSRTLRWHENA